MKRVTSFLAVFGILMAGSAAAQTSPEEPDHSERSAAVDACHAQENGLRRLACYDQATGYSAPVPATPTSGGWIFVENEDAFTNRNTSYAYLDSDRADVPMSDAPASLVVRCDGEGGTDIYVLSGGYIGARRDQVPVRFRFGTDPAVSERWSESTDGRAAFLPNNFRDFRRGLDTRQDFVFELTDYRGNRSDARFVGVDQNTDQLEFVLGGCR